MVCFSKLHPPSSPCPSPTPLPPLPGPGTRSPSHSAAFAPQLLSLSRTALSWRQPPPPKPHLLPSPRAAHSQWLVSAEVWRPRLTASGGPVLKSCPLLTSCEISWGLCSECIAVQLCPTWPLSSPPSLKTFQVLSGPDLIQLVLGLAQRSRVKTGILDPCWAAGNEDTITSDGWDNCSNCHQRWPCRREALGMRVEGCGVDGTGCWEAE